MKNGKLSINEAHEGAVAFRKAANQTGIKLPRKPTVYEKFFGTPERAAASLKDIEQGIWEAIKASESIGSEPPIDWLLEQANLGIPSNNTTHSLIEWLQEECE